MADDPCKRKPLLYADLFKPQKIDNRRNVFESSSSVSGDSCSSGFSTPFGSKLSSCGTESVDESFMAEYLSRQMVKFMLQEEEKSGESNIPDEFELKSPPAVLRKDRPYMQHRGGSGMQAIFLGENGSGNRYPGTGVFLPRLPDNPPTPLKKKSGCSTVLIPTRVLHALELHFSRISNAANSTANGTVGGDDSGVVFSEKCDSNIENLSTNIEEEMRLPQEWTY